MCFSSNNSAQQAAAQANAQNQANIASATSQINALYDSPQRAMDIGNLVKSTRQYYTNQLNQQNQINARNLKFAMARSGLVGGSAQADQSAQLGKDYEQGLLTANQRAQGAGAQLKAQDEASRAQMLGLVQSGMDATAATQQGAAGIQSALQSAQAGATANSLGDVFGNLAGVYNTSMTADAVRRGMMNPYGSIFPMQAMMGGIGYGGYGGGMGGMPMGSYMSMGYGGGY